MNPKAVGEQTEAIIIAHLLRKGFSVSLPFGDNQRYDLILDTGEALFKVQCKTAQLINGCVLFRTHSKSGFTGVQKSYKGEVDIFAVYCPKLDTIYRVNVDEVGHTEVKLRIDPPRGGPTKNIRWAKDYSF